MQRIVFLDSGTVPVELRKPGFSHTWSAYEQTSADQLQERLANATIIVTNKVQLREPVLSKLSQLRLIAVTATGYDNIEIQVCRKRGIAVANVPGYAKQSVPEHVFLFILALRRNLVAYREAVRAGRWKTSPHPNLAVFPIEDLHGSLLGLVGYGALARGVEQLARAFGMQILIAERKGANSLRPGRASFADVLKQADIVSLHSPLTPETQQLLGTYEFSLMKPSDLLINTARGGLIDEAALAEALRSGRLAGAGLDVLSEEPPKNGSPLLENDVPNLIVTPHVAWTSRQALAILAEEVILNIEAFNSGRPRNLVTL